MTRQAQRADPTIDQGGPSGRPAPAREKSKMKLMIRCRSSQPVMSDSDDSDMNGFLQNELS